MCRDLIDRKDLLSGDVYYNESKTLINTYEVLRAKSVDAVEVVRCKDCSYSTKIDHREPMWECRNICRDGCTQWLDSEDFCSYGERRKE